MKKEILKELIAKPGKEHHVSDFNPSFTTDMSKQDAKEQLGKDIERLSELQSMLYAQDCYSIWSFSGDGCCRQRWYNQTCNVRD